MAVPGVRPTQSFCPAQIGRRCYPAGMVYLRAALCLPLFACLGACTPDKDPTLTSASEQTGSEDAGDSNSLGASNTSAGSATTSTTPTTSGPDPTTSTDGSSTPTETTTETSSSSSSSASEDTGTPGECRDNSDCPSNACLEFRDHDPNAACVEGPPGGNTRFPGTLVNFVTGAPLPATDVKFIGALDGLLDPEGATPVLAGTSDAAGRVDVTSESPLKEGIGVVAVVGGGPMVTTITGAATASGGQYGPMSFAHDFWAVPTATLAAWSALLMQEPALAADLPLGEEGGALGIVRDASGQPVAGAVVQSQKADTDAEIRYLGEDQQSFNTDATASSGVFVLLRPGLAENFTVAGEPEAVGTAASALNAIFVMTLDLP